MEENQILELGFKKNQTEQDGVIYTEYIIGNGKVGIEISGTTLVEITEGRGSFITVPNCQTIEDLKQLIKLFNIK